MFTFEQSQGGAEVFLLRGDTICDPQTCGSKVRKEITLKSQPVRWKISVKDIGACVCLRAGIVIQVTLLSGTFHVVMFRVPRNVTSPLPTHTPYLCETQV